jgi:hypothetical protein
VGGVAVEAGGWRLEKLLYVGATPATARRWLAPRAFPYFTGTLSTSAKDLGSSIGLALDGRADLPTACVFLGGGVLGLQPTFSFMGRVLGMHRVHQTGAVWGDPRGRVFVLFR